MPENEPLARWTGDKFDGEKLETWEMGIELLFIRGNCEDVVYGDTPNPKKPAEEVARMDPANKKEYEKDLADWKLKNNTAMLIIWSSLSANAAMHVRSLKVNARDITSAEAYCMRRYAKSIDPARKLI